MNGRGGKREGAGRKKSPALAKITGEINQKHWKEIINIYIWKIVFSRLGERSVGREPS